jgi:hypothetical protein
LALILALIVAHYRVLVRLSPLPPKATFDARREALQRLVLGIEGVLFSETLAAEGAVVVTKACELGLEGIVSKRQGSFYKSGRTRNWLKTSIRISSGRDR